MWGLLLNKKVLTYLGIFIVIAGIGVYLYYTTNKVGYLESEIANKELFISQLEGMYKQSLENAEQDRLARDAADAKYQQSLKNKDYRIVQLNKLIDEATENDEEFKECMSKPIPDSVYDSLFKHSTITSE